MLTNLLLGKEVPLGGAPGNISEAALYALIGYLVVFAGIAFLIFIVWAVGKLLAKTNDKTASISKETTVNEKKETVETVTEPIIAQSDEISEETLAAITAAIMAYYEKNNPKCEFTLKRIKRM